MRLLRVLGAALVVAGVLALVPVLPASAAEVVVTIRGSGPDPRDVSVAPGTTVTWVNGDGERHRVRSTSGADVDSGNLEPGDRFSFTFTADGRTTYVDDRDRADASQHGSVTVTGGGGTAPGPAPAPAPAPGPGQAPPSSAAVTIGDGLFSPSSLVVAPGGTVTWTNGDDRAHTATADDGSFDTGSLGAGASSTKPFPNEGTFAYFCEIHPDMTGTVTVSAAGDGGGGGGGGNDDTTDPTDPADPDDDTLPETGIEVGAFVYLALALIGAGSLCVRLARLT